MKPRRRAAATDGLGTQPRVRTGDGLPINPNHFGPGMKIPPPREQKVPARVAADYDRGDDTAEDERDGDVRGPMHHVLSAVDEDDE